MTNLCGILAYSSIITIKGNLECLKIAHNYGCDWRPLTPYMAAKKGNLECLKYSYKLTLKEYSEVYDIYKSGFLKIKYIHIDMYMIEYFIVYNIFY